MRLHRAVGETVKNLLSGAHAVSRCPAVRPPWRRPGAGWLSARPLAAGAHLIQMLYEARAEESEYHRRLAAVLPKPARITWLQAAR